jgi:kynurenine formamidase
LDPPWEAPVIKVISGRIILALILKSAIMKSSFQKQFITAILFFLSLPTVNTASAQTRAEGPWWPNKLWGADDQAGGSNWITPEKILKAVSLVKTGQYVELGHPYEWGMPMTGKRTYNIFIPSFPTYPPTGKDSMVFNDEYVTSEIGQVGTQFDGPGHPGRQIKMADGHLADIFYNGVNGDEMKNPYGLQKLGVEHVKPIITRGIYIDLVAYKGVSALPDDYEITKADVLNTLSKQGMKASDIEPGDALLFNLGWWKLWPDKKTTEGKPPYADAELIQWIVSMKPSMVGSDAILDRGPDFMLHEELILKNGIFNLEYMNFEHMQAGNKQNIFLFIFTPVPLKGATGSPGRPLAIF